jgi:hypothetical protein
VGLRKETSPIKIHATYQRRYGAPQLLGRLDAEIVYKVHGQLAK